MQKFRGVDHPLAVLFLIIVASRFTLGYTTGPPTTEDSACYGSCPGRGQPYTGRGCKAIFGCRGP
ncbi:hypothetical protein PGT21_028020 [Puccinia graminis f. sp. tritici]|uniref:Uncharacterized protein n=1 Tax=Puccinia graminis f. sp. tritici TaxID=56615 RepID=A0A5B0RV06_PUCGR|nr:hypothetical protein PGT21_028020 [Puccinia graminis f. sp. tritici]KAA1127939.1 hypothetical protein PGTUg99_000906 [Puccinia graminis f. sp. tritici]KAA1129791.1 hypothetical protein PGTUg99_002742 [Puccinia graminis f. sp. tritici]